jgi:hypothetical protein
LPTLSGKRAVASSWAGAVTRWEALSSNRQFWLMRTTEWILRMKKRSARSRPVFCFDSEDEVIARANNSAFGLAAYFFTWDAARVFRVAERLENGMVGINSTAISTELAPFGGIKESGNSREGSHHGIDEYVEKKYVLVGGLN